MGQSEHRPAVTMPRKGRGAINVKVDPKLHREFAAACNLRDETIQDAIGRFMRATVAETFAAIRTG